MQQYTPYLFIVLAIAVMLYFLTQYQTFGLARFLLTNGATSKKKAMSLNSNVKAKFFLAIPLVSTLLLKREKNDKYWVSLEYKNFVIPFYLTVNTILIGSLVFVIILFTK